MILNLYKTGDDTRNLVKTLTSIKDVTAIPSENVSILNPSFVVEYDSTILDANYCYISELSRYYFINEIVLMRGNRLQFNCTVDVLMTYADEIKNSTAIITRSESIGTPTHIIDKSLPINPNKKELLTSKIDFVTTTGNVYLVRVRDSVTKASQEGG